MSTSPDPRPAVAWQPDQSAWLVTRHSLAVEVLANSTDFTVDDNRFSTAQVIGTTMVSKDGGNHLRLRRPFSRAFRGDNVRTQLAQQITDECRRLLSDVVPNGSADLRAEFAGPLAARTMAAALGLPEDQAEDIRRLCAEIDVAIADVAARSDTFLADTSVLELKALVRESASGTAPASFLSSVPPGALGEEEMTSSLVFFLLAGIDTTEGAIASTIYRLLDDDEQRRAVIESPELAARAVEEALRLEPAGSVIERYASRDVELDGTTIRSGDLVYVSVLEANRDPEVFERPDEFDLHRPNLDRHLSFAEGRHYCLGVHLARLEATIALRELFAALPRTVRLDRHRSLPPAGFIYRSPGRVFALWD